MALSHPRLIKQFSSELEVVLRRELHPAISHLVLRNTSGVAVGVHGQRGTAADTVKQQLVIRVASQPELRIRMVEPVGSRDANFDPLSIRDSECLEDRQVAAKVVRRPDVRPDVLSHLSDCRCCWRQRSRKAVGVEVLTLLQVLPWIAEQYRHDAGRILVATQPGRS